MALFFWDVMLISVMFIVTVIGRVYKSRMFLQSITITTIIVIFMFMISAMAMLLVIFDDYRGNCVFI